MVVPCYRVRAHILEVIRGIGPEVQRIYVVDDACPEGSGRMVAAECKDQRVRILYHERNQGVGGAMVTGYRQALEDGMDIAVKIDGDGQMDARLIPKFLHPLVTGDADYTKGNRFFDPRFLRTMPRLRLFGNAVLSFVSKFSTGYWNLMDPTNGYTAIHRKALELVPLDRLARDYYFESDMLFRLNTIRAVVREVPMPAIYGEEKSNLKIHRVLFSFPRLHLNRLFKRIFYNYFLRDFNVGSIALLSGSLLTGFGVLFGGYHWVDAILHDYSNSTGTVMVAALPILLGVQFLLFFLQQDITSMPSVSLQKTLP